MKKDTDNPEKGYESLDIDLKGRDGLFNQCRLVKTAMTHAIRESMFSRHQVAYRLSCLLGTVITPSMLDQLTSKKPQYQLKASQVSAFCEAVGNTFLIEEILRSLDLGILEPKDKPAIRIAAAMLKKAEAEREISIAQRELMA